MAKKKSVHSFVNFIEEPHISTSLVVLGLIALVLSIMEFSKAVSY